MIESLRDLDMVDPNLASFHVERLDHVGRSGSRVTGKSSWSTPFSIELMNWGDLYASLRSRVPDACFHSGHEVVGVDVQERDRVRLCLADGRTEAFDVVVFADGYRSLGRTIVCPEARLDYRGYVLWRGVLPESALQDSAPLEGALVRLSHPEGHAVVYFVPGPDRSIEPGRRWVNWACYLRVDEDELAELLTDRKGRERLGSLPPGSLRVEAEARLKRLASGWFPPYFSDLVRASADTFLQAIYTADVPRYRAGRICLAGDAGAFVPPFTASGVFKGMNNALHLGSGLAAYDDIDEGLERWSARETAAGARLSALGRRLEDALIWSVPDFGQLSTSEMEAWWRDAAKPPEELFPPSAE